MKCYKEQILLQKIDQIGQNLEPRPQQSMEAFPGDDDQNIQEKAQGNPILKDAENDEQPKDVELPLSMPLITPAEVSFGSNMPLFFSKSIKEVNFEKNLFAKPYPKLKKNSSKQDFQENEKFVFTKPPLISCLQARTVQAEVHDQGNSTSLPPSAAARTIGLPQTSDQAPAASKAPNGQQPGPSDNNDVHQSGSVADPETGEPNVSGTVSSGIDSKDKAKVTDMLTSLCKEMGIITNNEGGKKKKSTKEPKKSVPKSNAKKGGRKRKNNSDECEVESKMSKTDSERGELVDAPEQEADASCSAALPEAKVVACESDLPQAGSVLKKLQIPGNSDIPVELPVSMDINGNRLVVELIDSSYPRISIVRRKEDAEDRCLYLNKTETNNLINVIEDMNKMIEVSDFEKKFYLSHKTFVTLNLFHGKKQVSFTTLTSNVRHFYFNLTVTEFLDFLLVLLEIRKRRNILIEMESELNKQQPKSLSDYADNQKLIFCYEVTYNMLEEDMITLKRNEFGMTATYVKAFLNPDDMYDFLGESNITVVTIDKKTLLAPNPSWIAHVVLRLLVFSGVRYDEISYNSLAVYVANFFNKFAPGYLNDKHVVNSCKSVIASYKIYPHVFFEEVANILKDDHGEDMLQTNEDALPNFG